MLTDVALDSAASKSLCEGDCGDPVTVCLLLFASAASLPMMAVGVLDLVVLVAHSYSATIAEVGS
jgi:hypothetical protein